MAVDRELDKMPLAATSGYVHMYFGVASQGTSAPAHAGTCLETSQRAPENPWREADNYEVSKPHSSQDNRCTGNSATHQASPSRRRQSATCDQGSIISPNKLSNVKVTIGKDTSVSEQHRRAMLFLI